ncbi:MAG TPA: hypothetical protein VHE35_17575 [Kofleriaceae bacterium]|nr:hypothetical protein [Kofleriaceae bacterium]
MRTTATSIPCVVLVALAGTAHADPLTDFEDGTVAQVTVATVDTGGSRSASGGRLIEKHAGTADFDLAAADLGVDLPITLHLHGHEGHGGRIDYEIDEELREPVYLDRDHALTRITGRLSMRALPLPGTERAEVGNVYLAIDDRSVIVATGSWGSLEIPVTKLAVKGGILQPPLDRFDDRSETLICSGREATLHTFAVSLAGGARGHGALVQFHNEPGAGVLLPAGIVVAAGSSTTTITARIAPDFVGRARLTAAAGGVERAIDLEIHAARDCERR